MRNVNVANNPEMTEIINKWIEEGNRLMDKIDQLAKNECVHLGAYYLATIANYDRLARANPTLFAETRDIVTSATKKVRESETN